MTRTITITLFTIAALAAMVTVTANAQTLQDSPDSSGSGQTGIIVHGHGEIQVQPDVAYATLNVVTESKDETEAVKANATRSQAVNDLLTNSGVVAKDIQTQYYTIQPQYDTTATPPVLLGYLVTNSMQVTVRNIAKAGLIIDKAVQAGANQVNGISFDLEDHSRAEGLALAAAVTNARSKADLIAGSAGVELGRLITITDEAAPISRPVYPMAMMRSADAAAPVTPISPQALTITEDVTAVYAISYPSK